MRLKFLIIIIILITLSAEVCGQQRKVRVPEGYGTLNEAIRNDTTANGQRRDPNTIYVLKRGGVYVLSGTILASGFNLYLEAEEGDGPRPYMLMGFLTGAAQVDESIKVFNNLSMKSIYLTNINEFNTYLARIVSVDAPNVRLEFNDCLFDGSGQTFIRLNSGGSKIYMRNCTVSRMGRPSNPDNGRVIDDRGNQVDSIVVENNTWYNVTSRVIRDGGAEINYVRLNQNTYVNGGQRFAQVGPVREFYMNNNLIVNPRYIGNSPTSEIVALEFSAFGSSPVINFDYNNIYYEKEITDTWDYISTQQTTPKVKPPFVSPANQIYLTNATGLLEEELSFENGPVPPVQIILESELGSGSSVSDWDWSNAINTNPWGLNALAYHNFAYSNTSASYTGSNTGEPLGDLRWFLNYEITWNLVALIKEAEALISEYENNAVIESNPIALTNLQSAIAAARTVAENPAANRAITASSYQALQTSMQSFKSSFIITNVENPIESIYRFFPNPVRDFIYIPNTEGKADQVIIRGVNGQVLIVKSISMGIHLLETDQLPTGINIIQYVKDGRIMATQKMIKQ
ncbi:MAG: T9SS type A sorting domain-containing protein [Cyclobacteriaceae bacterium]|nr:T9SS type A sorting domain-containing protein [Cyclobacteriaceae bacterium]UYN85485.1 MAG: T9SS type A sorting domain-containing protein [Cyclobacteriaceae bacterium]